MIRNLILIFSIVTLMQCSDKEPNRKGSDNDSSRKSGYFRVTVPSLRLRSEPNVSAVLIIGLKQDRIVQRVSDFEKTEKINGTEGKWLEVETLTGHRGYIFDPYIEKVGLEQQVWDPIYDDSIFPCSPQKSECRERLNAGFQKKESAIAFKEGDTLIVHNSEGSKKLFEDNTDEGDSVTIYQPTVAFLEGRYLIITVQYYEGGEYLLYDRKTETTVSMWNYPLLSPDQSTLIVTSMSDAYIPNGIQVIKLGSGAPVLLKELKTEWHPCYPKWINSTHVALYHCHFDYSANSDENMVKSRVDLFIEQETVRLER